VELVASQKTNRAIEKVVMNMNKTILIIGSGFAGTALALFLKRAGFQSAIYESRSASEVDTGAFLYLAPNGMNVLRTLGLEQTFEEDGFPTTGIAFYNSKGKRIGELDNKGDRVRYGAQGHVLKRERIFRLLRDEVVSQGIPIQYGHRLEGLEMQGEQVIAHFQDGSSAHGAALIGADGINSSTRQVILPDAPQPRFTGLVDTGGFTNIPRLKTSSSPQHMIFGKRAFFAYMTKPSGEVFWFSNVPWAKEPSRDELNQITSETWKARLLELHAGDQDPVLEIIRSTPAEHLGKWPTREMPPLTTWHKGRVCLIGDAAHATSPSAGQGASLALEDAIVLAKCLRDEPNFELAFARFQNTRKARVDMIVQQARRNGDRKVPSPLMGFIMNLLLPTFLKAATSGIDHMYGFKVEWNDSAEQLSRRQLESQA
jgi:2-polyprenyl-6-methoxyphenol hydroxylase-like FAD-dependent oxidoreductase